MALSFVEARSVLALRGSSPICYDLNEVETHFGVKYTLTQRKALQDIPFSEDVLRACGPTHMLFPGFAFSLLDVRARHSGLFSMKTGYWYAKEKHAFSQTPVSVCWYLVRIGPVPGSFRKTWKEQCKLLLSDEVVPTAALLAFAAMLHFGAAGERLFRRCFVRTSDVDVVRLHVAVGIFVTTVGFCVSTYPDFLRDGVIGLSSMKKS